MLCCVVCSLQQMEEMFARRDAADAEEIRLKEDSMATSRVGVLESLRVKNAEWEARQLEVASLRDSVLIEDKEGEERAGQTRGRSDREEGSAEGQDEEEEEEEEDILAALDGKKRVDSRMQTATLIETEKELEVTAVVVEDQVEVAVEETLTPPVIEETEEVAETKIETKIETNTETETQTQTQTEAEVVVVSSSSSETMETAVVFDEDGEVRQLSYLTVNQLKALAKEEGVETRKGRMLKKDYVTDVCQARKRKSLS